MCFSENRYKYKFRFKVIKIGDTKKKENKKIKKSKLEGQYKEKKLS